MLNDADHARSGEVAARSDDGRNAQALPKHTEYTVRRKRIGAHEQQHGVNAHRNPIVHEDAAFARRAAGRPHGVLPGKRHPHERHVRNESLHIVALSVVIRYPIVKLRHKSGLGRGWDFIKPGAIRKPRVMVVVVRTVSTRVADEVAEANVLTGLDSVMPFVRGTKRIQSDAEPGTNWVAAIRIQ